MRIAIVNDILMAVEAVRRVIAGSGGHELAWVAFDGEEALTRAAADTPDLILMDLIMPRLDGVEATRRIMAASPCAIVIVTANVNENSSKVFEAMGAGALDAVNTPVLETPGQNASDPLVAKIETIRKLIGAPAPSKTAAPSEPAQQVSTSPPEALVAIGASAGGPAALAKILSVLPMDFPAPIMIVQHVDAQFAKGLADWLRRHTSLRLRLAEEGDRPAGGMVLLAGTDNHLILSPTGRLTYTPQPVDCSYRPSIDVLFKSLNRAWQGPITGVLLTGMGRDGAEGLLELRSRGHHTIAQDRASSAVFGMPKAAAELGAASEILALDKIGPRLVQMLGRKTNVHA